jgi:hypothetical protein
VKILEGNKVKLAISHNFIFSAACGCAVSNLGIKYFFEPGFNQVLLSF